jgi:hypothetical protein
MNRAPRSVVAGLLLAVSALQSAGRADETTAPDLATVIAHWEAREERLGSLHVEWRRGRCGPIDLHAANRNGWRPIA